MDGEKEVWRLCKLNPAMTPIPLRIMKRRKEGKSMNEKETINERVPWQQSQAKKKCLGHISCILTYCTHIFAMSPSKISISVNAIDRAKRTAMDSSRYP